MAAAREPRVAERPTLVSTESDASQRGDREIAGGARWGSGQDRSALPAGRSELTGDEPGVLEHPVSDPLGSRAAQQRTRDVVVCAAAPTQRIIDVRGAAEEPRPVCAAGNVEDERATCPAEGAHQDRDACAATHDPQDRAVCAAQAVLERCPASVERPRRREEEEGEEEEERMRPRAEGKLSLADRAEKESLAAEARPAHGGFDPRPGVEEQMKAPDIAGSDASTAEDSTLTDLLLPEGPDDARSDVIASEAPTVDGADAMAAEDLTITITLDRSLDLTQEMTLKRGSTVYSLKVLLAEGDPTGTTQPGDFGLCLADAPDKVLPDGLCVTEEHLRLEVRQPE